MSRTRAVLAGVTAAVAAGGFVLWRTWPGPRHLFPLAGAAPAPVWLAPGPAGRPHPRWLAAHQWHTNTVWAVDRDAGTVRGPYPVPVPDAEVEQDAAGNILVHADRSRAGSLWVIMAPDPPPRLRIDPATGEQTPYWPPGVPEDSWTRVSDDHSTLAVVRPAPGGPLAVDVVEPYTGAVRRRLTFPARVGSVGQAEGRDVAAGGVALSPDGELLALGEGWRGGALATPPGIELVSTRTGDTVRRLPTPAPGPVRPGTDRDVAAAASGAFNPYFTPDGRAVGFELFRRVAPADGGPPFCSSEGGGPGEYLDVATGRPDPDASLLPKSALGAGWLADDGRVDLLWSVERAPEGWRVVGGPGGATDWRPMPGVVNCELTCPAAGGAVFVHVPAPAGGWLAAARAWLSLPPAPPATVLSWCDARTGDAHTFRVGGTVSSTRPDRAGGVCLAVSDPAGARVEVWDAPPRDPWPPASIAGALAGTLAAWGFGRRRQAVGTPPALPVIGSGAGGPGEAGR